MASAPEIPLDIREAMRDCILALFWPKKKIAEFFTSVEVPPSLVVPSGLEASRNDIVTEVFGRLSARPDRGYPIFQLMIDRLSNWTYFDPYYFEKLGKLDKGDAAKKIARLKLAVDRRNATTEKQRSNSSVVKDRGKTLSDLATLKNSFGKLFGTDLTPQKRGILFEIFLKELFNRQSIKMTDPFRLTGEQIDGSFKFEGENYIVEAKWLDARSSTEDLYKFAYKVDGKMYGRGLFISVNGFSSESFQALVHGKHLQTILMDGEDLSYVLEERTTLAQILDYKIRAAQTRGEIYVCSLRDRSKV